MPSLPRFLLAIGLAVLTVAPRALRAQSDVNAPRVVINPNSRTIVGTPQVPVTFYICADAYGYDESTLTARLNGSDVLGYFTPGFTTAPPNWMSMCVSKQQYTGTIPLASQENTLQVSIVSNVGGPYTGYGYGTFTLAQPARAVTVTSPAMYTSAPPGQVTSKSFRVTNTASSTDSYSLSLSCSGQNGSCSMSAGSVTLAAGQSTDVTVYIPMPGAVGATATAKLIARSSSNSAAVDSSWTQVTATATPSQGVMLASMPDYQERRLCTRLAVAGGSIECGDLMLDHALPAMQSMNRSWTPRLIYNSQTAAPSPTIAANVTLTGSQPDSVTAVVVMSGVQVAAGRWPGAEWGVNRTRRIALNWNAANTPTDIYSYTLEVSRWNGGSRLPIGTVTGKLTLLNLTAFPYALAAGWWVSGVETIHGMTGGMLWIGPDGSTRIYTAVAPYTWVGRNMSRPDTLIYDPATTTHSRLLDAHRRVVYNIQGQQIATVNANGWGTGYDYDGAGRLSRIRLPTPAGANGALRYEFAYPAGAVVITAIGNGAQRTTTLALSGNTVTSITDPDGSVVYFEGSSSQPQRIVARTDERGTRTAYTYAPGFTVRSASTPNGVGQTATVTYVDSRTQGLVVGSGIGTSVALDSAWSRYDGPRTDVSDVATFWENEYGAPVRTRDPLGNGSKITYSTSWPGLAVEVRDAANLLSTSTIDPATGLLSSTTAFDVYGDGRSQTTTYEWDASLRVPTRIINPAGDFTRMTYDGAGNRLTQTPGDDIGRRVSFDYDGFGRVTSVTGPLAPPSTVQYEPALGNIASTTPASGPATNFARDAFGRETSVTAPIDGTHNSVTRTEYDVMGRVSATTTVGPAMNGAPVDSVRIEHEYDLAGNRTATRRRFRSGGAWQYLSHSWSYDALGRLTQEIDDGGTSKNFTHDLAGNVLTRTNANGGTVTSAFDAANRLVRTITSAMEYGGSTCQLPQAVSCFYALPTRGSGVSIPVDTAVFGYDGAGRLTTANNRYARISRWYAPNGALLADAMRVRATVSSVDGQPVADPDFPPNWRGGGGVMQQGMPAGGGVAEEKVESRVASSGRWATMRSLGRAVRSLFGGGSASRSSRAPVAPALAAFVADATHRASTPSPGLDEDFAGINYVVRYHYDINGRRDTLYFPTDGWRQSYSYHPITGAITGTIDPLGYSHTLTYDARDRVTAQDSPGWHVGRGYDLNDNLVTYNQFTLTVDQLGRVTRTSGGNYSDATNLYDGLGHVIEAREASPDATREQFGYDALGNRNFSHRYLAASMQGDDGVRYTTTNLTGQVSRVASNPAIQDSYFLEQNYEYDGAGNSVHEYSRERTPSANLFWENRSYYGADDKLRVFSQFAGLGPGAGTAGGRNALYEEYWYDALGRRIRVRARRNAGCSVSADSSCYSTVKRTVWDGDQVLQEHRTPGSDSTAAIVMDGGAEVVSYVHLAGIDAPVAVLKGPYSMIVPHANWRAVYDTGHAVVGGLPRIRWPGSTESLDQGWVSGANTYTWFGDVIGGMRDGSGQKYMRNRYYDPAKGTFTQKDPIGLAGGLNLYGYAGGDAVNYSDPFGLKGCPLNEPCPDPVGQMISDVNAGLARAVADLANKTLEITAGFANDVTHLGDVLTAVGQNPNVQSTGGRVLAGVSALFGVVANGPKVETKALGHIFRDAAGHVNPGTVTSEARYMGLFEAVAGNAANRNDAIVAAAGRAAGVQGFTQRFRQGEVWVHVISGKITNAGVNPF